MEDFEKLALERQKIIIEHFKKEWFENLNSNLKFIKEFGGIIDFRRKYERKKPAIVIGAGPSLEKNYFLLEKVDREKTIIIATDKANSMTNYIADFVISVDSQKEVANFFEASRTSHQILIALVFVNPLVINKWQGMIKFFNPSNSDFLKLSKEERIFDNLEKQTGKIGRMKQVGFVGLQAIEFAKYISCYPIILIGMDFGWTDNKTYAFSEKYSDEELSKMPFSHPCFYSKYPSGEIVQGYTSIILYEGSILAKLYYAKDEEVINCTEGGTLPTDMTFQEAIEKWLM